MGPLLGRESFGDSVKDPHETICLTLSLGQVVIESDGFCEGGEGGCA